MTDNEQFLLELKKRRLFFMLLIVLFFAACYAIQYKYYNLRRATVEFSIVSNELIDIGAYDNADPERVYFDRGGLSRVYSIIYSTELIDSLISRFDLYNHYQIDKSNPDHYEQVMGRVLANLGAKKKDYNMLSLTFSDKDGEFAALVANETINQVNIFFQKQYKDKLSQRVALFESVMYDVAVRDSQQRVNLYNTMRGIEGSINNIAPKSFDGAKLHTDITYMMQQLINNSDNQVKTYKLYRSALYALDAMNIKTVSILKKALPDRSTGFFKRIVFCAGATFLFACVIIVGFYFYNDNKRLLKLFFSK